MKTSTVKQSAKQTTSTAKSEATLRHDNPLTVIKKKQAKMKPLPLMKVVMMMMMLLLLIIWAPWPSMNLKIVMTGVKATTVLSKRRGSRIMNA
jgi:hypothetical protein